MSCIDLALFARSDFDVASPALRREVTLNIGAVAVTSKVPAFSTTIFATEAVNYDPDILPVALDLKRNVVAFSTTAMKKRNHKIKLRGTIDDRVIVGSHTTSP